MFDFIVKILLIFLRKTFLNNKKIILIIIIFIYVKFFLIVDKRKTIRNENIKDLVYFNQVYNDYNVSTTNYLIDYNLYRNKIYDLNLLLNKKNIEFKSIELNTRSLDSLNKNEYLIVEYTPVFGEQKFCYTDSNLVVNECPFKNCKFTCDKSYQYKADALIFSEFDLYQLTIEDRVFLKKTLSNHENRHKQVWILWNDEAFPVSSAWDAFYFNWTMSYRADSEISDCSYGCTYSKKASYNLDNLQKNFIEKIHRISLAQKNQAVWFVSNCNAGYRIRFALNLEKYYNLKIYGNCKQQAEYLRTNNLKNENYHFLKYFISIFKSTSKFFSFNSKSKCDRYSECELNAFKSNKYYLSFESKNCTSYITEKLWKILRTYMIPIVIQPSKNFYELVAPKNSFIHAQDFNYDAEKLAKYLNLLDNNFDLYLKYHMWRLEYDIVYTSRKSESRRLCELCTRLNQETSTIYYKKISSWFASDCIIN